MNLEGRFELPELLRLSREDLELVQQFVLCSGSLKELCAQRGQSYPTIRQRLNDIIETLSAPPDEMERKRRQILDAIARGDLSVKEATQRLKELWP